MKVYVIQGHHGAEGSQVYGVFNKPLSHDEAMRIARERTDFKLAEFESWIGDTGVVVLEFEVEDGN